MHSPLHTKHSVWAALFFGKRMKRIAPQKYRRLIDPPADRVNGDQDTGTSNQPLFEPPLPSEISQHDPQKQDQEAGPWNAGQRDDAAQNDEYTARQVFYHPKSPAPLVPPDREVRLSGFTEIV